MSRQLIPTGLAGLDEVLFGGVLKQNFVLVEGKPGTGKTTLALQFLIEGALKLDSPGILLSFETSREKLIRDATGFGWDLQSLEQQGKLLIHSTTPAILFDELHSLESQLVKSIQKMGAQRFVLDGLTPFRSMGERSTGLPFREALHLLIETLHGLEVTPLLTTESVMTLGLGETGLGPEHFIADTIVTLKNQARQNHLHRLIEVAKSRGQDFISGAHSFDIISGRGIEVYPRVSSRRRVLKEQASSTLKSSVGIPGADEMFGGGVYDGSITLAVGISGTGKTVAGMQFLAEGARLGKKGLLVTLDEHPQQICRNAASLGLDFNQRVENNEIFLHYESPLEVNFDIHFAQIQQIVEKHEIERVVIDSIVAYELTDKTEAHDFIFALASYFKDRLVTAFFNYECPELLGVSQISDELKASTVADNIMLLNYVEISTRLRRAITIPKTRGSRSDKLTREYVIQEGGIAILEDKTADVQSVPQLPLSSYYGVLARSPTRHSPVIDEHVAGGKPMPKTKLPKPSAKARKKMASTKSKRAH
jgi:circadian clock protein KaiC